MEVLAKQSLWRPGISAIARASSPNPRAMQGSSSSTRSIPPPYKPIRAEIQVPPIIPSRSSKETTTIAAEEKQEAKNSDSEAGETEGSSIRSPEGDISVDFYDPKVGDVVVGMVVSGNASKLEVDIGAQSLGMMFARDLVPLERFKMEDRIWTIEHNLDAGLPPNGRALLAKDDEVVPDHDSDGELMVDPGTVLEALVIGKTLSGMALLSMRNFCRPIAWQRVRDIYNAGESVEVRIESYNLGGLICRIEGLTAFLPKDMIQNSPRDVTQLKEYVGRILFVIIIEVDESKSRILVNERAAWVQQLAPQDSLVQGIVTKVESYGVVVRIDGTDLSALLHISNISHRRIARVADIFTEGDTVTAVVLKPRVPDKVILSTLVLEREKGMMLTDKQRVFQEADDAFRDWRRDTSRFGDDDVNRSSKSGSDETTISPQQAKTDQIANLEWLDIEQE